MAQEHRTVETLQQRHGELLECVGQNDDLREGSKLVEKLLAAGQRAQRGNHGLNVGELQPVPIEQRQAATHKLVVVRLVAGRAAQFGNARLFGDGNPDLRHDHAFEVERDDGLLRFHGAAVFQEGPNVSSERHSGLTGANEFIAGTISGILTTNLKSEFRIPNSEAREKPELRIPKARILYGLWCSAFGFRISFGFRASEFGFRGHSLMCPALASDAHRLARHLGSGQSRCLWRNLKVPWPLIVCGPLKNSISAR